MIFQNNHCALIKMSVQDYSSLLGQHLALLQTEVGLSSLNDWHALLQTEFGSSSFNELHVYLYVIKISIISMIGFAVNTYNITEMGIPP